MTSLGERLATAATTTGSQVRGWLTPRRVLRLLVVAVPLGLLLVPIVRGASGPDIPHYERPDAGSAPTTVPPTTVADPALISLLAVEGTTTTAAPPAVGAASLAGSVVGPQGAVPGAVVRIERLVGDAVLPSDVFALADGTWSLSGVPGGRYRIRAFLPPTLAQTQPEIIFVEGDEQARVDLTVESFAAPRAVGAVAPDPPVVDELVNFAVQLEQPSIDGNGVVVYQPLVGWIVEIQSAGAWVTRSAPAMFADLSGRATFLLECRSAGPNQIQLVLRSLTTAVVVPTTVAVPDCVAPAPETTTSTPGSSTSETDSSSSSTTTTR
jgi:hypothetical protein